MKKMIALLLTVSMVATLTACGNTTENTESTNTSNAAVESETENEAETETSDTEVADTADTTYTVGICQLVQHEALDAATQGFKDALTEALGDKVTILKVNFDENKELTEKLEVKGYPTLILFKDGAEVKRLTGLQQKPALIKAIEEVL